MHSPTRWDILRFTLRRVITRRCDTPTDPRRDTLLLDAAVAIRSGRCGDAERLLEPFANVLDGDAMYLNLCGVICESRKDLQGASRFYGLAMSVDSKFEPAQQNMVRIYEMNTFGCARNELSLGDVELRAKRQVPQHHATLRAGLAAV